MFDSIQLLNFKKKSQLFVGNCVSYQTRTCVKFAIASWLLWAAVIFKHLCCNLYNFFNIKKRSIVVIVNGYTGVLAALMTVPKLNPTINTLGQLAVSPRFKLSLDDQSLLANQMMANDQILLFNAVATFFKFLYSSYIVFKTLQVISPSFMCI